ncbi:hypothetical protein KQX54_013532 [Cotesia glomerata]|uniref:MADF domain-containing protein n=1 Tax=Cotesia glomerata TaxID=32391 RepID=A0AAV7J495_COTGL|nr:hypothetical protein KQX54_013532 [Cotesia glomerata]
MNYEKIQTVYTCGLCEIICAKIQGHVCLEGYEKLYVDNNHYFYPMLDDGETIVRRSALSDGSEKVVSDSTLVNNENASPNYPENREPILKRRKGQPKKQLPKQKKLDEDETEMLIMEVEQRIPLWNFNIPIEERSRETVAALWEEVSEALNGIVSAETAKKKFKSLRDTYRKIVSAEHRASGSARIDTKQQWRFYKCCEFLRDSCLLKSTSSNVAEQTGGQDSDDDEPLNNLESVDENDPMNDSMIEISSQISGSTRSKSNRNRVNNSQESHSMQALNRIADIMCKETQPLVLPEKPTMDAIDYFLSGAGHEIRKLPESKQFDTCMEILNLIHRLRRQYAADNEN